MTRVYNSMVWPADLISLAVFVCVSYCIAADSTRFYSHVHSVACDYSEIKFDGVGLSLLASCQKGLELLVSVAFLFLKRGNPQIISFTGETKKNNYSIITPTTAHI